MRRLAIIFMSITAFLLGANSVQADSVWHQSYERSIQTQECVAQSWETPWQDSWGTNPGWSPSWEQWANNGEGGWTCNRSITWARDSAARVYNIGDIGPGGGLIFLIANGLRYEMAPKTWGSAETNEVKWCNVDLDIGDAEGTAVGTGVTNTEAMVAIACSSGAGNSAVAYTGGGYSDWFLPSKDELNAMCNYSRNPDSPALPSVSCYGSGGTTQDASFAISPYGFHDDLVGDYYWSSSAKDYSNPGDGAWGQDFFNGSQDVGFKSFLMRVRPVRAF